MAQPSSVSSPQGQLKVYLGYAAGVGKTYQMLQEAQHLKAQGKDVVVGYFEPHARPDTTAQLRDLELIPRLVIEYRGAHLEEMDSDAILRRHPQICVVDEFPHTNAPGSERSKRWQDVLFFLDHGIDVLTTMNVQHLESQNDHVYEITGVRVRETVPDWVVQQATEVVMVDLSPRALLNRLDRGVVYQLEKAQRAKENFFKESTLVALRELALRETAFEVEARQKSSDQDSEAFAKRTELSSMRYSGHVMVHITPEPSSAALIRRAKRVADYLKVECFAVAVSRQKDLRDLSPGTRHSLEKHLHFARNLHIHTQLLEGTKVAEEIVSFARSHRVTQIYLARPGKQLWRLPLTRSLVQQVSHLARDMEVTIVAERQRSENK